MANLVRVNNIASSLPNGKTATPINDVILLQKCAGISSPTYNNLSDLMADTGVLNQVISSNNAIDYLVRSTSFAKSVGLVPAMTSNTTPSGVCSADSESSDSRKAYKAFDGNKQDGWVSISGSGTHYLQYEFPEIVNIFKIYISRITEAGGSASAYTFKLQYRENNEWKNVFNDSFNPSSTLYDREWSIDSGISTDAIRILGSGSGSYRPQIEGVQFYTENGLTDNSTAMTYIGQNNYASNTLLGDSTWCSAIFNSTYFESVLNVKVPTMTSNTTPSGVASGTSIDGANYNYYQAFSSSTSYGWNPGGSDRYTGKVWYQFTKNQKIYCADIRRNNGASGTTNVKIITSNDGTNWTNLNANAVITNSVGNFNTANIFVFNDILNYDRYGIQMISSSSGTPNDGNGYKAYFYGREDV